MCGGGNPKAKADPRPQRAVAPAPAKADAINIRVGDFEDHDVKILTLGAGECGKSTIWQQPKLIHCGGIDEEERASMHQVIRINVVSDVKTRIDAPKWSGQTIATELANAVDLVTGLRPSEEELLWGDPILRVIYRETKSIGLGDNAAFFLDSVARIAAPRTRISSRAASARPESRPSTSSLTRSRQGSSTSADRRASAPGGSAASRT
jgi:hypothetical protein